MDAVIDSNVIVHGRKATDFDKLYTVPEVEKEMKSTEAERRFRNMDIHVQRPGKKELEEVRDEAEKINSPTSDADEKIVALASTLDKTLLTDDKAMQNLALRLDIDFEGYMEGKINSTMEWELRCDQCGKNVSSPPCPRCGHQKIVRKPS